jgi:hypothetical protein
MIELIRNAKVDVHPVITDNGDVLASITINDKYDHTFEASSRISRVLSSTNDTKSFEVAKKQLQERMTGGDYFMVDNQLVDFRDSMYNGFVHSDDSIKHLIDHIGIMRSEASLRHGLKLNTQSKNHILANRYSSEDLSIQGLEDGGIFNTNIIYSWSPFTSFVKGAFELVRLVCTNGMVGTTELINSNIPLVNRWEEHLRISNKQMQNAVQGLVGSRMKDMVSSRASVTDLRLIAKHAENRLTTVTDKAEKERLERIKFIADPMIHLPDYYSLESLQDSNIAAQLPGHLSEFDAWNCITEIMTHTADNEKSTPRSLQGFANNLVFPKKESNTNHHLNTTPLLSAFSNPEVAFFGA